MPDVNVKVRVDESELEKLEKKLNKNNKVNIDVSAVGKAGREVQNLDTSIKNIAATKLKFDAFRLLQQQCSEAVKSVKELNEAMTLVKMTMMDLPDSKIQDLASQSLEMAKELSAYTKTVTDAVTIFANANESVAGILNKAQPTVLLATAANMSASNAADTIQGIINQFEMADDQAMKIADTIEKLSSEIALDFSKGVSTISEAVSTGGSVINEAGMTFERYGAIVSATAERTRLSGNVIGNAYKTIAARISRSKDGETSPEDIANAEKAFNSVGVTIRNEMGDFRDLSDTLDDLNSVWGTLTKSQRSYIAEQAAGVRQKNVFISMMNEYSRMLELEEAALNASGTAMEINEVRAESIDGKMQKLSATMSEMYNHAVSEDAIKGMLVFADSVMGVVDNLGLMQGALAAVGVVGVSNMVNVLKTHWQSIFTAMTSPTSLVAVGVGTAVAAWSAYQRSIEEAVSSAREAASTWSETNSSLEEQAQRVRELREELAKGNLTEEEAYQAKSALFDIQQQLSESYGEQADGIDLVNGKLETQIDLIEQLSKSQANEFLNENMKGIEKAEKEMTKSIGNVLNGQLYLGQFFDNGTSGDVLKDIINRYNDYITTQTDIDGITTNVYFKGDATSAKEVLNDFMTDIRNAEDEINDENILDSFQTNVSAGLQTANEIIDEYQGLYQQAQQARLIADENLYGTGEAQKTAIEWVNEYTKAVEKYNDAILTGDNSRISDAAKEFDAVNASIQDLVANSDMSKYADQISEVRDQLNNTAIASLNFKNALDGTDTSDLGKQLKSYADDIKELNLKDIDFKIALETDGAQQGEESIRGLADAADEAGLSVDQLIDILTELGYIQGEIADVESEIEIEVPVSLSISETVDQLNLQLKPAMDSLGDAWDDIFTEDGFELAKIDILAMCGDIKSELDDISELGLNIDYSAYENFVRVLTNTESTVDDVQDAFNDLATSITNAALLGTEDFETMKAALEDLGVVNNEIVAFQALISNTEALKEAGLDLAEVLRLEAQGTEEATAQADAMITAFAEEMVSAENCGEALALLKLKKELLNGVVINTAADIQQILGLASSAGVAADALVKLANAKAMLEHATEIGDTRGIYEAKKYARQITSEIQDGIGSFKMPTLDFNPGGSNTRAAKSAGKKAGDDYKKGLQEALSNLGSLLSGITGILDKQISKYQDAKSAAVDSLNEQKDAALEALRSEKEAAVEALETERDLRLEVVEAQKKQLEEQIKLIDQQIKQKQKIIDGINDEIKAMKDANDERKRQVSLQEKLYQLERMQNQRTILQYSEDKGMHYVQDLEGTRKAKDEVDDAKLEIEIANKEKQIDLIEKEIDLLEERKESINEQISLLDEEADKINDHYDELIKSTEKMYDQMIKDAEKYWDSLIKETESYWDGLIKNVEEYKSRFEELAQLEENAKVIDGLKKLGYTTEDIMNMSAEAFEKFKDEYVAALYGVYEGNESMQDSISEALGSIGEFEGAASSIEPVTSAIGDASSSMDNLSGSADSAGKSAEITATNLDTAATNAGTLRDNLSDVNTTISEEQTAFDNLKKTIDEVIQAINDKIAAIQEEQRTVGIATSSEMADFLLLRDKILEVKESIEQISTAVSTLDFTAVNNLTTSFRLLYDQLILVSNVLGAGMESQGGENAAQGTVSSIASAIEALNDISLEDGIIAQFNNLKTAVDEVTAAIGGGGESSGGEGEGGGSASGNSGSGGGESEGGSGGSLTDAITQMGETANEVIGEPNAEGDGTVIGEFGSMKTAVNEVSEAIGIGGEEGSGGGGQGEDDGTLIGSINDLGTTTEEVVGERGEEDTIIGRFEEFRDVIGEADAHVKSISDGLDEIDGKEVECTIKIKIETSGGGLGGLGLVNGSMNLNSATYTARYGAAHVEGTALVSGNWALQSEERNALVGELGRELIVFPDGHFETVGDTGAQFVDIPKNSIVFNHLQTEELLKNGHISGRGKAYADGTVGDKFASGVFRPLQPGDRMWDLQQKMNDYLARTGEDVHSFFTPVNAMQKNTEQMAQAVNTINNINNSNRTQQIVNQEFHISLPNVNDSTTAIELMKDLQSISMKKLQMFN